VISLFVNFGGFDDRHCLNFLFVIMVESINIII